MQGKAELKGKLNCNSITLPDFISWSKYVNCVLTIVVYTTYVGRNEIKLKKIEREIERNVKWKNHTECEG